MKIKPLRFKGAHITDHPEWWLGDDLPWQRMTLDHDVFSFARDVDPDCHLVRFGIGSFAVGQEVEVYSLDGEVLIRVAER